MYELSLTEHVMMSSDQRSSLCLPINLLGKHATQTAVCKWKIQHHYSTQIKIFHEDKLNFRRFPVFQTFPGAVDTLFFEKDLHIKYACFQGPRHVSKQENVASWRTKGLQLSINKQKQAFIDIRLRPSLTTPQGALYFMMLSLCMVIWPTTAERDVIHKTGST